MIIDDIADLFENLHQTMPAHKIAEKFEKERKYYHSIVNGSPFVLDWKFVSGLSSLGYELKLVKKGK